MRKPLTPKQAAMAAALGFKVTIELSQEEMKWLMHFEGVKNWENTTMIVRILRRLRTEITPKHRT